MASTSSAKKVARVAASSGSKSPGTSKNWLFPAGIIAILALGIGAVAYARSTTTGDSGNTVAPKAQLSQSVPGDHWHAAFAINVCNKELPALTDAHADTLGIHTHGDGLAHIHPFSLRTAGHNATLGRFFDQTGTTVTDTGFKLQDGKVYKAGTTTCSGQPTKLVMAFWKDALTAATTKPDKVFTSGFNDVRFFNDHSAYTLALIPKGSSTIPAPSSAAQIEQLSSVDTTGSSTGSGSVPATTPVTTPATTPGTTAPKQTPTTGAGG